MHNPPQIGIAFTGSFCTLSQVLEALEPLKEQYALYPIMSPIVYESNTRFGTAAGFRERLEALCGRPIWHTIPEVEPIGPKKLLDALVIAPCTGNTLAKLACGMTDTSVTMAAKAHLRNGGPVVIALASNDGLSGAAGNIGALLGRKNFYFVPFGQDDPAGKPCSLMADFTRIGETVQAALEGRQLQPVLLRG